MDTSPPPTDVLAYHSEPQPGKLDTELGSGKGLGLALWSEPPPPHLGLMRCHQGPVPAQGVIWG